MIQAFSAVSYSYMDLIQVLAEKRLALAQKIDSGKLTEDQADVENAEAVPGAARSPSDSAIRLAADSSRRHSGG